MRVRGRSHGLLLTLVALQSLLAAAADESLMIRGGCVSCHRIDQRLLGPSFKDVAARYRADPDADGRLFAKVRDGGEGQWGDLPMQPNSEEKISDADLRMLIDWILAL
jgi:cytochrome c